jgi:hypothetical protein
MQFMHSREYEPKKKYYNFYAQQTMRVMHV